MILCFSAFNPKLGLPRWTNADPGNDFSQTTSGPGSGPDEFNNWAVKLPADFESSIGYFLPGNFSTSQPAPDNDPELEIVSRQLWV
jgi:hypothetical protein